MEQSWKFLCWALALTLVVILLMPIVREVIARGLLAVRLEAAARYVDSA